MTEHGRWPPYVKKTDSRVLLDEAFRRPNIGINQYAARNLGELQPKRRRFSERQAGPGLRRGPVGPRLGAVRVARGGQARFTAWKLESFLTPSDPEAPLGAVNPAILRPPRQCCVAAERQWRTASPPLPALRRAVPSGSIHPSPQQREADQPEAHQRQRAWLGDERRIALQVVRALHIVG